MAVAFEQYGRLHYLDPGGVDYHVGDWVLYPTDDGAEVARVVGAMGKPPSHNIKKRDCQKGFVSGSLFSLAFLNCLD